MICTVAVRSPAVAVSVSVFVPSGGTNTVFKPVAVEIEPEPVRVHITGSSLLRSVALKFVDDETTSGAPPEPDGVMASDGGLSVPPHAPTISARATLRARI